MSETLKSVTQKLRDTYAPGTKHTPGPPTSDDLTADLLKTLREIRDKETEEGVGMCSGDDLADHAYYALKAHERLATEEAGCGPLNELFQKVMSKAHTWPPTPIEEIEL